MNQPFASERDHHPGSPRIIHFLLDLRVEADGAHDTVAELLVQDGLVRIAVVLHDLVEAVDQRLDRRHGTGPAPVREPHHLLRDGLLRDSEDLRELIDILGRGLHLAVEEAGDRNLTASELLG